MAVSSQSEDAAIIASVLKGDKEAYIIIVHRYHDRLRSALSFYCSSPEAVEEHLQEAFVHAYVNLHTFDTTAPFLPWLKTIALNALRDELRRRSSAHSHAEDYLRSIQLSRLEADPGGSESEMRRNALERCLQKLPREHAELLTEKYTDERPLAELATKLKVTEGALKVRLLRIRQALKQCVEKHLAVGGEA